MKAPPSMKARAIQWLAQREHSELELRRKLLAAERRSIRLRADGPETGGDGEAEGVACAQRIDETIAWLRQHDFLNDARFLESRVHVRAPRFGVLRIRQELKLHGVALTADAAEALGASDFERADAMRRVRWGDEPAGLAEQARCARWLAGRGFTAETVARVIRAMRAGAASRATTERSPDSDR